MNELKVIEYNASPGLGVKFKAKCFIIEDKDSIFVISPTRMSDKEFNEIKSKDKNLYIIAPNNFHNIYLPLWKKHFPGANFFGPKRSQNQSGVNLSNPKDFPKDLCLKLVQVQGNKSLSESLFYHTGLKCLIATDILFNIYDDFNLTTKLYLTAQGAYKKLNMPLLIRLTTKDKEKFFRSIKSTFEYPFERVLLNHGKEITRDEFIEFISKKSN